MTIARVSTNFGAIGLQKGAATGARGLGVIWYDETTGLLLASLDGAAAVPVGSASFGEDTIIQKPNGAGTQVNALELILSMPPTSAGTEMSTWDVKTLINGVQTFLARFGQSLGFPFVTFGDPVNGDGIRANGGHRLQVCLSASTVIDILNGFTDFYQPCRMQSVRFQDAKGTNIAQAADVTLPVNGNMFSVTGSGSINTIAMSTWAGGSTFQLIIPSGITLKHNTAGAGTKIFSSSAADIVAPALGRAVWFAWDGTNLMAQA